jgi:phytoene/squalene synthetase
MTSVYETLLGQIEKNDYDVLNNRVGLSKFQKLQLLAIIWLRRRGFRFL